MRESTRCFGGRDVSGSVVLLGGPPEPGNRPCCCSWPARCPADGARTVYVAARSRQRRRSCAPSASAPNRTAGFLRETNLRAVLERARTRATADSRDDSIQTCGCRKVDSFAGSVSQVATARGPDGFANGPAARPSWSVRSPRTGRSRGRGCSKHLVDTVLYLKRSVGWSTASCAACKNRFGGIDEICVSRWEPISRTERDRRSVGLFWPAGRAPSGSCVVPTLSPASVLVVNSGPRR